MDDPHALKRGELRVRQLKWKAIDKDDATERILLGATWTVVRKATRACERKIRQGAAGEINRQISWIDVARLTDNSAQNLIVKDTVAAAKNRSSPWTKPFRRPRDTDSRCEVIAIRVENTCAIADERTKPRNQRQRRIVESIFNAAAGFARRRVVFVAQAVINRQVVSRAPEVLPVNIVLIKSQVDS